MIRHGTTAGNLEKRFTGTLDLPLLPEGEALARSVSPGLPEVEHVFCSPLLRCRRTAELLWPGVERTVVPGLREADFGPFEGRSHEELKDDPAYRLWLERPDSCGLAGVESLPERLQRVSAALEEILARSAARGFSRAGVVSHGGTIMDLLFQYAHPRRPYYDWLPANCGGFRVEAAGTPLGLRVLGEAGGSAGLS